MNLQHQQQNKLNGSFNNNYNWNRSEKLDDNWNEQNNKQKTQQSISSTSSSSTESSPSISSTTATNNDNNHYITLASNSQDNLFNSNNSINSKFLTIMSQNQQQQQQDELFLKVDDSCDSSIKKAALNGSPELMKRNFNSFKGTYKKQKEDYLSEKRRITNDMLTVMRDEKIIILADWLKIRGTLKNWIKLYCVLKPGILLLYKNEKYKVAGNWLGTILLNSCELLERPSKKHGFCFKLFHPLEKSIWASKGPDGESSLNMFLLPTFYLIFRAPTEEIGACWMNHLELTMKSSNITNIKRTLHSPMSLDLNLTLNSLNTSTLNRRNLEKNNSNDDSKAINSLTSTISLNNNQNNNNLNNDNNNILDNNEIESVHFNDIDENNLSDSEKNSSEDDCSFNSSILTDNNLLEYHIEQTNYIPSPPEEFGELGNGGQTEEIGDENKSLIWGLVKQVRPGMDLSKVILPTFILEPRSFLEKLTDFYYHSDILSECINDNDPFSRMKNVIKFYLSGFYKKPKGLKKPYNPALGELFRCYWQHNDPESKTFYIGEQVSHHPPISAFYVTNRKEGFCIYGSVLARSKFYGNSVSAVLEGKVKLVLLNRGEEYVITMPYANCKGILIGKLTMELGGKISIECAKTGYLAELEFKLKPLLGGIEASNIIDGKIKLLKNTVATLKGRWDDEIYIYDKLTNQESLLWCPTKKIIESRLKRFIVPIDEQKDCESERLWLGVSDAIKSCDQYLATEEKAKIEQRQRELEIDRKTNQIDYETKYFKYDKESNEWMYIYKDLRPWDNQIDQFQYENNFQIDTKTIQNIKTEPRPSLTRQDSILIISENEKLSNEYEIRSNLSQMKIQFDTIQTRLEHIENKIEKLSNIINNDTSINDMNHQLNLLKLICLVAFVAWLFSNLYGYLKL